MAFHRGPKIVTNGLVLYLDAANNKSYPGSGTAWNDLSGGGNNGTLLNGPTFDNGNAGSIVFDGISEFVRVNTLDDAGGLFAESTTKFSVSSFFKFIPQGQSMSITNRHGGTGEVGNYIVYVNTSNNLRVRLRGGTPLTISNITPNTWYEIVITWDGSTAKAYLNSSFINNISVGTASLGDGRFIIGAASNGINLFFKGKIPNVKIYNRALTPDEIQQNYNATKSRYGL